MNHTRPSVQLDRARGVGDLVERPRLVEKLKQGLERETLENDMKIPYIIHNIRIILADVLNPLLSA